MSVETVDKVTYNISDIYKHQTIALAIWYQSVNIQEASQSISVLNKKEALESNKPCMSLMCQLQTRQF